MSWYFSAKAFRPFFHQSQKAWIAQMKFLIKIGWSVSHHDINSYVPNSILPSTFYSIMQIPLPPVDEKKKVIEDVDKDRRYAIDASIVRIMKSRKVLGYQQLVMECVEQLGRMFKVYLLDLLKLSFQHIYTPCLSY